MFGVIRFRGKTPAHSPPQKRLQEEPPCIRGWFIKSGAVLLLCILLAGVLDSCRRADAMSAAEMTAFIQDNINFIDMTRLDRDKIFTAFFNVDEKLVKDAIVYVSSQEEKADELAILQLADRKDFDTVLSEINSHISIRALNFSNQSPTEFAKMQNAAIGRTRDSIILVVCEQYEKASEILKEIGVIRVDVNRMK